MGMQGVNLQQIAAKLFGQQPQNPLYPPADSSQGATSPQPQPAAAPSSPAPTPTPAAPSPASDGASLLYGSSAPKPPMSQQDYASANPDASKPFMPARPVGDFDTGKHATLRRILANLFAGTAEFGGELNHHPGMGGQLFDRWHDQDVAQRQYDANQPRMQAGALNQAYQNYLQQGGEQAGIEHTQQETQNLAQNSPAAQRKAQFAAQVQQEAESGKWDPVSLKARALRMAQFNRIPVSPDEIDSIIQGTKPLGSKYTLTRDQQTQAPIELVDRQGNHYSQSNLPKDPEAQQMWNDATKAAAGKEQVEEGKEKRVAGYAADRQAQAFGNQQKVEGQKAAADSQKEINDARNQQSMIEQLLGGKMNPASQTAAMFKMIGLEQPTGTHRIMPAEVEGIEHMGGLSDRLKQKLLNWKEGDRFSPDLIPDVISTAKILSNSKLKTANDNLESTYVRSGYKLPGADVKGRLDKPGDYQQPAGPAPAAGSAQHVPGGKAQGLREGATGTGSDGKKYVVKGGVWAPAQ